MKPKEGKSKVFPGNFANIDEEIIFFQKPEHYEFVPENNIYIQKAREAAIKYSLTSVFPIGIVAVKDGVVVAEAGNGNGYHERNMESPGHRKGCVRRFMNDEREKVGLPKFKGGEGFELCPGCHTDSHAEANLIKASKENGNYEKLSGADVYMYGHFWCCKDCMTKMQTAGVENIFLPETYEKFKDKSEVGKWAEELQKIRKERNII